MKTRTAIMSLVVSAAALGAFGIASAQSRAFDLEVAPGFDEPDNQIIVVERELVQPFNSSDVTQSSAYDQPINEFAGQRIKTDPGLIGGALGNVKRTIFGK